MTATVREHAQRDPSARPHRRLPLLTLVSSSRRFRDGGSEGGEAD